MSRRGLLQWLGGAVAAGGGGVRAKDIEDRNDANDEVSHTQSAHRIGFVVGEHRILRGQVVVIGSDGFARPARDFHTGMTISGKGGAA